ncbi:MAG: hypothetical protein ACR2PA_14950 [Hyphomicrobiaceae bacterium]
MSDRVAEPFATAGSVHNRDRWYWRGSNRPVLTIPGVECRFVLVGSKALNLPA